MATSQELQKEYQDWLEIELFPEDEIFEGFKVAFNTALLHTPPIQLKVSIEQYKAIADVIPATLSNMGKIVNVFAERTPSDLNMDIPAYIQFQEKLEKLTNRWYEIVSAKGEEIQSKMPKPIAPAPQKGNDKPNRTISMSKAGKA